MAFGGILLFNLILTGILGAAFLGAVCLLAALILTLIRIDRKRTGKPLPKWMPILSIALAIAGVLAILPLAILLIIGS